MPEVVGVGTDIESVARVKDLLTAPGQTWRRWFTDAEIAYCLGKSFPERHLAARLAAKEAAVKALGIAAVEPPMWRTVEVVRADGRPPRLVLHDDLLGYASAHRIVELLVSLSHTDQFATATVIALAEVTIAGAPPEGGL